MVLFKVSNQTLHKLQSGNRSSKFVKLNMEEEHTLKLIINSESLPIIIDSDVEIWSFNSYSRGNHEYTNIRVPLIGNKALTCLKVKGNVYDPHTVASIQGNVVGNIPQNTCSFFWKFISLPTTSMRI